MPRYIDAETLTKKIFPYDVVDKKDYSINAKAIYKAIENAPTEDVVPRSEVEEADKEIARLKEILTNYALQYGTVKTQQKVINQAKQEIAREIFEEIEGNTNQAIKRLKDAKEGVTDKDLRNYVNGKIGEVENTQTFIAELKKKYIGE